MKLIKIITNNGIKNEYSQELKRSINLTNVLNFTFIIFVLPFLYIFKQSFNAVLITTIPIWLHIISFILIKYDFHKIGRAIFSLTTATTVFFVACMVYVDDGTYGMAAKFLIIVGVIFPFIAFEAKDWKISFPLILLIFAYIYFFDYYNSVSIKVNLNQNFDTNILKDISVLVSGLMFVSSFYYYRKLLSKYAEKLTVQKNDILDKNEELNQQNEEMQAQSDNLLELNDEMNLKNNKLLEQKEKIQVQAKKLLSSTQVLEKQNSKLKVQHQQITDSVKYAKNIQTAILPFTSRIEQYIELFILYKPKDIVSGDFYWFTHSKKIDEYSAKNFIAAIDCTGHGVPGAFMSMIGSQLLNKIVNEQKITKPHKILLQLHNDVIATLKQTINENDDGMDVCLISIENLYNNTYKVCFSGARRPLFYADNETNKILTIKGTKKSIGGKDYQSGVQDFEEQDLILKKGTVLYLTSDGYIDQNGANTKRIGTPLLIEILNKINHMPLDKQKQYLENELDKIQGRYKQRDDITIIGIRL